MSSFKETVVKISLKILGESSTKRFFKNEKEYVDLIKEKNIIKIKLRDKNLTIEFDEQGRYYLREGYLDDLEEIVSILKNYKGI